MRRKRLVSPAFSDADGYAGVVTLKRLLNVELKAMQNRTVVCSFIHDFRTPPAPETLQVTGQAPMEG